MKTVPHLKIEQHPNPLRRDFHVSREIGKVRLYGFGLENSYSGSLVDEKEPEQLVKELADLLTAIPGVTDGHIDQYSVGIGIGQAFEWEDIGPQVVGVLVAKIFPECIGKSIEISATLSTIDASGYGHHFDVAKRIPTDVPADISEPNPVLDVESLFSCAPLQKVVDNGDPLASERPDDDTQAQA